MPSFSKKPHAISIWLVLGLLTLWPAALSAGSVSQLPLFLGQVVNPLVMLNLSNDHQLYFEAYPDYIDLTGDGAANRTYAHEVDYYGYFDSYQCYVYDDGVFKPSGHTADKYCSGSAWSGNFLNWVSMARIDVVRRILYGGLRYQDEVDSTVLERTHLPNDAHSWVRYYDGEDLPDLTPYSSVPTATIASSTNNHSLSTGEKWFSASFDDSEIQVGDQLIITDNQTAGNEMFGVVTDISRSSGVQVKVEVTRFKGSGSSNDWSLENRSRRGITFCNTSVQDGTFSQNVTNPPLIRVAQGDYALWRANERHQCRWYEEVGHTGHASMAIGGIRFSNGNDAGFTGIFSNASNPRRDSAAVSGQEFHARVQACVEGFISSEDGNRCKRYPSGNYKPVGLLQEFGEEGRIHFGLFTGSYARNLSGGVLRKNISSFVNEMNLETGQFQADPVGGGIVDTLDRFRIYGYRHSSGSGNNDATYNSSASGGDNCAWGLTDPAEGRCTNWGNPQSELYLESLRYLAGMKDPLFDFSGNDRIPGLESRDWNDPLGSSNYCAAISMVHFNASVSSYDADNLSGASDLPGLGSVSTWTNKVGSEEGIHGGDWFVGQTNSVSDQLCTPKTVSALSEVRGLCPEGPRQRGSFHIAGLAHYGWTEDLRPDLPEEQHVKTFGVTLAPAVPRIDIPMPGGSEPVVSLLPACRNTSTSPDSNCAIVDFRIVDQDIAGGTGRYFVQWEDSEQGGDFDMDMNGILEYRIIGDQIEITTNVFAESTDQKLGFGYVISGTSNAGFHVHSGINNFSGGDCNNCKTDDAGSSRTFVIGGAGAAGALEQPLFYAAKWGGFEKEEGVPAPGDQPDNYYFAIDPAQLASDLRAVFRALPDETSSSAAVATNSTRLDGETVVYQARFNSGDWSGQFLALPVDEQDGSVDSLPLGVRCSEYAGCEWDAAEKLDVMDWQDRRIFTVNNSGEGIPFQWDALDQAQRDALGTEALLEYLRGDHAEEERNGGSFRNRSSRLGDIVNSDPAIMGAENFGYADLTCDGQSYSAFLNDKSNRDQVLFVGANDGMLHAFDAQTGEELFAYVPNAVIPRLEELGDPDYGHRYFVDGSPRIGDACLDDGWATVLTGSTGAGGNAVFALNVTDPWNFNGDDVLWEYSHSEIGYSISQPTIGRLADDDASFWVIFGNGYGGTSGTPYLFLKPLSSSGDAIEISLLSSTGGEPSGLSSPIPIDNSGDRKVNYVYAGDLQGNLWRIDLQSNKSQWNHQNRNNITKLFQARDDSDRTQPIVARPEVGRHPDGGLMVYFGTGSFFRVGDNMVESGGARQSFYGIRDSLDSQTVSRSDLVKQEILFEGAVEGRQSRVVSFNRSASPSSDRGWYVDLVSPVRGYEGERVVSRAILRMGRIIFVTVIPSDDPCAFGGNSWLMELDAVTGANLGYSVFDMDGDGRFDEADYAPNVVIDGEEQSAPVSGLLSSVGIIKDPRIVSAGEREYKYFSGSTGEVEVIEEKGGGRELGRQSWRQLR